MLSTNSRPVKRSNSDLSGPAEIVFPEPRSKEAIAWADIWEGFQQRWFWNSLAFQDVKLKYRGSMIGPFWMTLSMVIMVTSMGIIYAKLFNQEIKTYLPYLATGIITWTYISGQINEGCQTFIASQSLIQSAPLHFSVHVYRQVWRNLIILGHNIVIIPPVLLYFDVPFTWRILEVIPAIILLSINSVWVCFYLGIVSARYRDVPQIVQNIIMVIFFITPIFWRPVALGKWQTAFELNPFFAALDIVRAPILGQPTAPYSWAIMIALTVIGCGVTFRMFSRFRSRIAYWV